MTLHTAVRRAPAKSNAVANAFVVLRRQCACGARSQAPGECTDCAAKRLGVQPRLAIGASNDPLEREADRVADHVLATPAPARASAPSIQRESASASAEGAHAPASVERALAGAGHALDGGARSDMERRFGHDFSQVRVHSDGAAADSARDIGANAYTAGPHIVFAQGQYRPSSPGGQRLLAHELTHVVQQAAAAPLHAGATAASMVRRETASATIRRDDAGGGSTDFKDSVSTSARHANGVVEGQMTRTETAPATDKKPKEEISRGSMNVRFDPSDCSLTIPFGYKFVSAATSGRAGMCESPPPSTAVPPLPAARFNEIKAGVLATVNSGLNGWFDLQLSGKACPGGCADKPLPIRVVAREDNAKPDTTVMIINRGGRADSGAICANDWNKSTSEHEGGHQALGVGDEYPETDERLRATAPQWFRTERVRNDYSKMGPAEDSRLAMFHERHFNAVKTFMEDAFPGCKATLNARARPVTPDFRASFGAGYASFNGQKGLFMQAGVRAGIPLDRMRRFELVLGPQFTYLATLSDTKAQDAFLLGARLGLEGNTGGSGHGFTGGVFGEAGGGHFSSTDYKDPTANRTGWAPYGALGAGAGYRSPVLANSFRFEARVEGTAGKAFGGSDKDAHGSAALDSDPRHGAWFQLGATLGAQF